MMGKEICRKEIIRQANEKYLSGSLKKVYLVGQKKRDMDFIRKIISKSALTDIQLICGAGNCTTIERDIARAQLMLLQQEIDGILYADSSSVLLFEKNIQISNDLDKIYEVPYYFFKLPEAEAVQRAIEIFSPFLKGGRLSVIQFDITDKCNLNCALCSHFSPLVKNENRYILEQFERDVIRVKNLTEHVEGIDLWGGEALLHPQLDSIIAIARDVFPDSKIAVGTNGLLVPKISGQIINSIKNNDCWVRISGYPPTMKMKNEIVETLENNGIKYVIEPVGKFFKRYELLGTNSIEERHHTCSSKICHVVKNGTFSSCYAPYGFEVFNKYFSDPQFDISKSIYDLFDKKLDMCTFTSQMKLPIDACKYCGEIKLYDWRTVGNTKNEISQWVHDWNKFNLQNEKNPESVVLGYVHDGKIGGKSIIKITQEYIKKKVSK